MPISATTSHSAEVRADLTEALTLDLIGPDNQHRFAHELLPDPPSRWYLTGFLVPTAAPADQKTDETATEQIDSADDSGGMDDAAPPDRAAARKSFLPSSLGLSVLVSPETTSLEVAVRWGDYLFEGGKDVAEPADQGPTTEELQTLQDAPPDLVEKVKRGYRREPREERVTFALPKPGDKPGQYPVPNSRGLTVVVTTRCAGANSRLPANTLCLSVFLVNNRDPHPERAYRSFTFQAGIELTSPTPFVPRPDLRNGTGGQAADQWDEAVADLQYRDVFEYAIGHGVSAHAEMEAGICGRVRSVWIPRAEVNRVEPSRLDVALAMEDLGVLANGEDAAAKLSLLVEQYRLWIKKQREKLDSEHLEPGRLATGRDLLVHAEHVAKRIEAGIAALNDEKVLESFRTANRAMAAAARRRDAITRSKAPNDVEPPKWRPFQLAFILMSLRGIVEPTHGDREIVDLLFFPTGGGKTEAYLGLAAFTMVLRRLRQPGIRSAGVTVLMRYTLRLLTLDQMSRAAALMCALELERSKNASLGTWPFEIGLWVGSAATPNRMGRQGDDTAGREYTAYTKTMRFKRDSTNPAPIPIENCPWCGEKFTKDSFGLVPNARQPLDLRVRCVNHHCEFSGDNPLPLLGVDEPIYRRLPAFLIATVDKFAALPWTGEAGTLFGLVDRYDKDGFYGPCDSRTATSLGAPLPPPELIIQDELHLISGPLGTIAGVYEITIDALASRQSGDKTIRPKIVASTATVRRAEAQIRALFDRQQVTVFPPPGPDRRDSFFAKTVESTEKPARLYVGVAAQGRSLKVVLLRVCLALLSASKAAYDADAGKRNPQNAADPYLSLLGYFNSLRELGGSRRIVEDEVRTRVAQYGRRRRRDPEDRLFTNRDIDYDVLELTSRVSTNQVATAKRRLSLPFANEESVDVALATNMISVGLDITRLGLMVVLGQPKTSAEYIQATSRVGRAEEKPGLVVTLLNVHKPRDRSHYERFETYHATFYRSVEATSVTPFSPRAMDRALAAALVAMCRHGKVEMTQPLGASEILALRASLDSIAMMFAERATGHDGQLTAEARNKLRDVVFTRCQKLLDDWLLIAQELQTNNIRLQYQREVGGTVSRLLYEFLNPDLANLPPIRKRFRANRSMRDVEPNTELTVKPLNDWGNRA